MKNIILSLNVFLIILLSCTAMAKIVHAMNNSSLQFNQNILVRNNFSSSKDDFGTVKTKGNVGNFYDFGDNASSNLIHKFKFQKGAKNILHFGDSHVAGDYFTERLRFLLQKQFGVGGTTWIQPMAIKGQRNSLVNFESSNFSLINNDHSMIGQLPMGGFIASSQFDEGFLNLIFKKQMNKPVLFKFLLKKTVFQDAGLDELIFLKGGDGSSIIQNIKNDNQWHVIEERIVPPVTIRSSNIQLGGIWIEEDDNNGVGISSIGKNGAKFEIFNKWDMELIINALSLSKPDLIILAYGTNEAFDDKIDLASMKRNYKNIIRTIRKTNPKTAILIMSAPDSLDKSKRISGEECANQRPLLLNSIQKVQKEVAIEEGTLFWDWQKAMGGNCSMFSWQNQKLAKSDGIHLTKEGYYKTADLFYQDFIRWIGR